MTKAIFNGENGWGGLTTGKEYQLDTRKGADGYFWIHLMGRKLTYPYSSTKTFKKDWKVIN